MSDITIAGGHGHIAQLLTQLLTRQLTSSRVTTVRSIIRKAEQADDIASVGGTPIVLDLEHADVGEVADAVSGSDAVVFAAGAGPGSGAERKETVDYGAAAKLIDACEEAGVSRYLMISSMGTDDPPTDDEVFSVYLRAKARADEALMKSGLDWTILRPGRLTDDAPTGQVHLARHVPRGEIPRADVARILADMIAAPGLATGLLVEAVSGDTPVDQALAGAAGNR